MTEVVAFAPRRLALPGALEVQARDYLRALMALGRAPATIRTYRTALEQLVGYCWQREVTLVQHVSRALLEDWLRALVDGEGMSRRSAALKLQVVRGFLRHCRDHGLIDRLPTEGLRVSYPMGRVVAPERALLLRVLGSIPTDDALGLRDRALFYLIFDAALRLGGALSLDVYDPQRPPQCTVTPSGTVYYRAKGGDVRAAVCGEHALAYLAAWIGARRRLMGARQERALFVSRLGRRMSRMAAHQRLKLWARRAGVPELHPHLLRHARLGDVMARTGDLRLARDLAGHKSIRTTADLYGNASAEVSRRRVATEAPLEALGEGR